MSTVMTVDDPKTFSEAVQGTNRGKWLVAMNSEIDNIEGKGTWVETTLPTDRKAIGRPVLLQRGILRFPVWTTRRPLLQLDDRQACESSTGNSMSISSCSTHKA